MKRYALLSRIAHQCFRRFAVVALTALAWTAALPAGSIAQSESRRSEEPVAVEITGPASVMVGEPLLLKWRLTNRLNDPVFFHRVGDPRREWLRLELYDSDGRRIYGEPAPPPASLGIALGDVSPGASVEGTIAAPARVLPKSAGKYTLRAHVVLSFGQIREGKILEKPSLTQANDLPLQATPAEEERLRAMAFRLREQFLAAKGLEKHTILDALLSIKESAALPAWQALADDPRLDKDGYAAGIFTVSLGAVATPATADLLIHLWGGASVESKNPGAKGALQDLYRTTADVSPKAHIRKQFEAVGGSPTDLYDGPMKVLSVD